MIRDRVKELRRVKASELIPNPKNWRTHPDEQKSAIEGILDEVGYAGAVIAYETPEGLRLIDGHLRRDTTPDQEIPVLVLDVDEAEADKLLATFDPLGAMAEADSAKLADLMKEIDTGSEGLQQMLSDLAEQEGIMAFENDGSDGEDESCDLQDKYCVMIECDSEQQQTELLKRFEKEGLKCRLLIA